MTQLKKRIEKIEDKINIRVPIFLVFYQSGDKIRTEINGKEFKRQKNESEQQFYERMKEQAGGGDNINLIIVNFV